VKPALFLFLLKREKSYSKNVVTFQGDQAGDRIEGLSEIGRRALAEGGKKDRFFIFSLGGGRGGKSMKRRKGNTGLEEGGWRFRSGGSYRRLKIKRRK